MSTVPTGLGRSVPTTRSDILVVGGGGAALRAAVDAAARGCTVTMVQRGRHVGKGGATSFGVVETAGYSIPDGRGDPADGPDTFRDDVLRTAQGCADEALVDTLVGDALAATELLRDHGLEFMRNPDGSELVARGDFASRPRNRKIWGHGKPIAALLARLVDGNPNVTVLASATVVELLTHGGRVSGGLVVNRAGELVAVTAGATILATGGAGQLFEHSLMPTDITGSGYALAARAGAELANMEFVQAGFGTLRPAVNMVMPWYWGHGAELLDGDFGLIAGRDVGIDGTAWDTITASKRLHYPFSASDPSGLLELSAHEALRRRPLTARGGLFMRLPGGDGDDAHGFWEMSRTWLEERGFDLERRVIEVGLFGHSVNGGTVVDVDGRTTVPGLYAAGETAAGAYGADRLGGTMLLSCQVFGRRAALAAAAEAAEGRLEDATVPGTVREALDRFSDAVPTGGRTAPREVAQRLKRGMSEHVLVSRDEESLKAAGAELGEIERAVADGEVATDTMAQRLAVEDLRNLALSGLAMVAASTRRTETRGAHYRSDFPTADPAQARRQRWQRHGGEFRPVAGG